MLDEIKIRTKLLSGFIIVALIAAIIGFVGWNGMNNISNSADDIANVRLSSVDALWTISESQAKVSIGEGLLVNRRLMDSDLRQAHYDYIDTAFQEAEKAWTIYESLPKSQEEQGEWDTFIPLWNKWRIDHQQIYDLSKQKDQMLAQGITTDDDRITQLDSLILKQHLTTKNSFFEAETSLNKLIEINHLISHAEITQAKEAKETSIYLLILFIVLGVVIAITIGLFISGNVQSIIKSIVTEVSQLSEAAVAGKLEKRANEEEINKEFRGIAVGINQVLDALINPLNMAAEYVERIASGDIPPRITDDYRGDFNEIKNNINMCIDSINALVTDANMLSAAAVEGKLDCRANASRHQGDYLKIVQGVNDTLDAVIGPLNVAAEYVDRIAHGDIPPRITDDYKGDFKEIKNNLNMCIDSLNSLLEETELLTDATIKGKLTTRADVEKFDGKYGSLIMGINGIVETLVNHIDFMPVPFMIVDKDLSIAHVNKKAAEAAGLDPELMIGTKCYGHYKTNVCRNDGCVCVRSMKTQNIEHGDAVADLGHDVHLSCSGVPIKDKNGDVIGSAEIFVDQTGIKELMREMNYMSSLHEAGDIDAFIPEDGFEGPYYDAAKGINNMVKGHIDVKKKAMACVKEFGKGNFDAELEQFPGKKAFINETIEQVRSNLKSLITDTDALIEAATEGKLDVRADASKHLGDFRKIVEGINDTLDAVINPLNETARVINAYAQGDLSARVTIDTKGDFRQLSDNLDNFGDAFQSVINDSCGVLGSISSNDLTRNVKVQGLGDFRQLTEGVEKCRLSLNEVVSLVNENAENVASTAQEISASTAELASSSEQITSTVNEISKGTQMQSSKNQEVSNAMRDMGSSVQEVANNSEKTAETTLESNRLIQSLGEMSKDLLVKMDGIKSAVSDSSNVIKELDDQSKQIGEIVSLITNIADQTNLLALNAAIEAARAGEHGRGFAVVADEVRKLAEDSGNAAKQIAQLIHQMQEETNKAVSSMKKGTDEVAIGAVSLERSVIAIGKVVDAGDTIVRMVQEIAAATEEQSASIEQITSAVEEIASISEQSAAGTQEASASIQEQTASIEELSRSAQEFADVAANMQSIVSKFRLDTESVDATKPEVTGKRKPSANVRARPSSSSNGTMA
jgi:methyl-accepting chemotaxis protein